MHEGQYSCQFFGLEQQDAARFIHFGNDLGANGEREATLALIHRAASALDYAVFEPESMEVGTDANAAGAYAAAA